MLAKLRAVSLRRGLDSYAQSYDIRSDQVEVEQLNLFNAAWRACLKDSPWARAMKAKFNLPEALASWSELAAKVPSTDKAILRELVTDTQPGGGSWLWRATGGTSAQPFRFPAFTDESRSPGLDIWLGRRWIGVAPADRAFLIWGHSHLLGGGLRGRIGALKRTLQDRILGYTRFSAYNLDDESLRRAGDALLASKARYALGYSVALDRFARVNAGRAAEFRKLNLAAVIATAEGLPRSDSRAAIEACFGAKLFMEYGSMETGPIAYETGEGGYRVFWRHHRLDFLPAGSEGERRYELLVTCLFRRALPLIRYRIGDMIASSEGPGVLRFDEVIGRCNEYIQLPGGASIHSEGFTHSIRDCPGVAAYQVRTRPGQLPTLLYQSDLDLPDNTLDGVRAKLARIHPDLAGIAIERRDHLEQSIAGKHRMVVTEQ